MGTEGGMDMDAEARAQLQSIIDALSPAVRLDVAKLPREHVILMHHGLGTLIRNQLRHGELRELSLWSRSQIGDDPLSLDALSGPILVALWSTLRSSSESDIEMLGRP